MSSESKRELCKDARSTKPPLLACDSPVLSNGLTGDQKPHQQTHSVFIGNQSEPFCTLLLIGNFDKSGSDKKTAYTETLKLKSIGNNEDGPKQFFGDHDEVTLVIWDLNNYDKLSAFPKYSSATMTVIIPSSGEDLRICYNSVFEQSHKPAVGSSVVYLNLFASDTEEFAEIEAQAQALGFDNNKLDVKEVPTANDLLESAIQHTRSTFESMKKSGVDHPAKDAISDRSNPDSNSCVLL